MAPLILAADAGPAAGRIPWHAADGLRRGCARARDTWQAPMMGGPGLLPPPFYPGQPMRPLVRVSLLHVGA